MSNFEIFLIIAACAVPVLALLFVLPKKFKKKEKTKAPVSTKTYEEIKKEEQQNIPEPPKEKAVARPIEHSTFADDDFKSYLKQRQNTMTQPKRAELPADFVDRTEDYFPRRRRMRRAEPPKTISEEIKSLSPELKALIITGALDKKDFDKI